MKEKHFQCKLCLEVFVVPTRRGRPPRYCDGCAKGAPTHAERKRQRANERVDRLTSMLAARGLSVSQQEQP